MHGNGVGEQIANLGSNQPPLQQLTADSSGLLRRLAYSSLRQGCDSLDSSNPDYNKWPKTYDHNWTATNTVESTSSPRPRIITFLAPPVRLSCVGCYSAPLQLFKKKSVDLP